MRRLFEKVLVCPPGENYPRALSTHPEARTINLELARKQHADYVNMLRSHGVSVEVLPTRDSMPDSVFIQDPALAGKDKVLIGRSREATRQPETEILAEYFTEHGTTIERVGSKAMLEGGDILVAEGTVFVGITGRTNQEGLNEVQRCFSEVEVKPVRFSTEFFHLLSACSYLADDQVLVCERYVDSSVFSGFECLLVASEDVVAVNVLYLGGGSILLPSGYPRVQALLRESGYEPVEIDNSEFIKGDGRITCLSLPFYSNLD